MVFGSIFLRVSAKVSRTSRSMIPYLNIVSFVYTDWEIGECV